MGIGSIGRRRVATAAATVSIALAGAAWSGCGDSEEDQVTDAVNEAVDNATDQADELSDEAQQQVDEAQQQAEQAIEDAQEGN